MIIESMRIIWQRLKIIIEPSCSIVLGAILTDNKQFHNKRIGLILTDENGLEVRSAEPDQNGDFRLIAKLGQKYPCRLRGIDIWSGSLDLTPK